MEIRRLAKNIKIKGFHVLLKLNLDVEDKGLPWRKAENGELSWPLLYLFWFGRTL